MEKTELAAILTSHRLWRLGSAEGSRADLYRADLSGANLYGANLSGANLTGADLYRADLSGANLTRAKIGEYEMTGKFTQIVGVSEWLSPVLAYFAKDHGLRIQHGCRHFSIAEAHAHWKDRTDRAGTRVALSMIETWAAWIESAERGV